MHVFCKTTHYYIFFVNYFDSYGTRKHDFALMDMIVFIFAFHTMSTRERFLLVVRSEVTLNLRIDWSQVNQSLKTLEIQFPQAVMVEDHSFVC